MRHTYTRIFILLLCTLVWGAPTAYAHHVIGRPAYNWNEDSNTPPSMQVDIQMGDYFITYMVFPAFPKPNEPGRINLYAKRIDNDKPFKGKVNFTVRDDSWFSKNEERIGVQTVDDNVFRQRFLFRKSGAYIITAEFEDGGVPYIVDFPLQIGPPSRIGVCLMKRFAMQPMTGKSLDHDASGPPSSLGHKHLDLCIGSRHMGVVCATSPLGIFPNTCEPEMAGARSGNHDCDLQMAHPDAETGHGESIPSGHHRRTVWYANSGT